MKTTSRTDKYQHMDEISHILKRPDMYIGTVRPKLTEEYVAIPNNDGFKIVQKEINVSPGFVRIFIEVLSNAVDNVERSKDSKNKCTTIKVNINKETGETCIFNDGMSIPIEKKDGEYIHTMIFGKLRTGENYNDDEDRTTSGRNGLGAKATCVYSKYFRVKGVDKEVGKKITQEWKNNMREVLEPIVEKSKLNDCTEVLYIPDFEKFEMTGYTDEILHLFYKYVIDTAMLTGVKVYLNGELIPYNNLLDYSKLYLKDSEEEPEILSLSTKTADVVVTPHNGFRHISFVNGIYTMKGGKHVDAWSEEFFRPLVDKFNKKGKPQITIKDIKQFFMIFVKVTVIKPEFESQSKHQLEGPNVEATVPVKYINMIMKWTVAEKIQDIIESKELFALKKTENKNRGFKKIEGYDRANNSSSSKLSKECTLILCEGDSAKQYAVWGIDTGAYGKSGRDWFGIMPLRGKLLNVRNSTASTIANNSVISNITNALGLKYGVDYTDDKNFNTLKYGRLMILTDADCFTDDTPIIIKINDNIDIISIENLYNFSNLDCIEIWSSGGWTKIYAVKRKETDKKIIEINSYCGIVRCTEDHVLMLEDGNEIKAKDIKIGDKLMRTRRIDKTILYETDTLKELKDKSKKFQCFNSSIKNKQDIISGIEFENNFCDPIKIDIKDHISEDEAFVWGLFFADGTCQIYTFEKDRTKETLRNTEKWVKFYTQRISEYEGKSILTKKERRTLSETRTRLKYALKNTNITSIEKNNKLYRTSTSWSISNCDLELLQKAQKIMMDKYPLFSWTICEVTVNENYSNLYKLILNKCDKGNEVEDFVSKFRLKFYDIIKRQNKKVPSEIINSNINIQKSFIDGYYSGDGFRSLAKTKNAHGFDILGQIGAQGLCFLLERLGYCISIKRNRNDIFTVHYSNNYRRHYPGEVRSVTDITYENRYVYDIETENHKLNAGIGGLIVHNCDGLHICGLVINYIGKLFPTLLDRPEPFIVDMKTPIAKVNNKSTNILFYDEREYNDFMLNNQGKFKKDDYKYYKGLGSSNVKDVSETFGKKIIEYTKDEKMDETLNKVFLKTSTDIRKDWLENYDPHAYKTFDNKDIISKMDTSDFYNNFMIQFSIADCGRNIPNIMDGLKTTQRKILYCCFKRKLTTDIKVSQLAGYVSEHSNYHHGESSLYSTITHMASCFVGGNNIPLLAREGMFGCLSPETPIIMWDGSIKMANQVKVGDKLIGDDGTERNVLKTTNGTDNMYEIITSNKQKYIVNSQHILTLHYNDNNKIKWKKSSKMWYLNYFDGERIKSVSIVTNDNLDNLHFNKRRISKQEGYDKILKIKNDIFQKYNCTETIDIKILDFINIPKYLKRKMYMISNISSIKWESKDVPIDPYILGIWLGYGNHDGRCMTSCDFEIIKEFGMWTDKINCVDKTEKNTPSIGDLSYSSNKESIIESESYINKSGQLRNDMNKWNILLKENNLMINKHIPDIYIHNDEKTRLELLAGFIDTDGILKNTGDAYYYEISQSYRLHHNLIEKLDILCKSLGFSTSTSISDRGETKKVYDKSIETLFIFGKDLYKIPVRLTCKKIPDRIFKKNIKEHNYTSFTINNLGLGEFYGWSIDKNERFLLGNFIVTHNSRLAGGKDAASPRYIFTKLEKLTRYLFPEEDDILLKHVIDDGDFVEPEFYPCIIPLILANPCNGAIGTGWSSNIPGYNPLELCTCIEEWLNNDGLMLNDDGTYKYPKLIPWYRGFKGEIIEDETKKNRFISKGIIERDVKDNLIVKELPIGLWTDDFKEKLEDMLETKVLVSVKNYSTPVDVHFEIKEFPDGIKCSEDNLKLKEYIHVSNLVAFTETGKIRKFNSVYEIIDAFCKVRYEYYILRKLNIIKEYEKILKTLKNKRRFIQEIIDDILIIFKLDDENVLKNIKERNFDTDEKGGYDYLLSIQTRSYTQKKLDELDKEVLKYESLLDTIIKTTEKNLWLNDLNRFKNEYIKFLDILQKEEEDMKHKKIKVKGIAKKK